MMSAEASGLRSSFDTAAPSLTVSWGDGDGRRDGRMLLVGEHDLVGQQQFGRLVDERAGRVRDAVRRRRQSRQFELRSSSAISACCTRRGSLIGLLMIVLLACLAPIRERLDSDIEMWFVFVPAVRVWVAALAFPVFAFGSVHPQVGHALGGMGFDDLRVIHVGDAVQRVQNQLQKVVEIRTAAMAHPEFGLQPDRALVWFRLRVFEPEFGEQAFLRPDGALRCHRVPVVDAGTPLRHRVARQAERELTWLFHRRPTSTGFPRT